MLKVTFTIDCDSCNQPFWSAAVCSDRDPDMWEVLAMEMSDYVQSNGWEFDEDSKRFKCDDCIEEFQKVMESVS